MCQSTPTISPHQTTTKLVGVGPLKDGDGLKAEKNVVKSSVRFQQENSPLRRWFRFQTRVVCRVRSVPLSLRCSKVQLSSRRGRLDRTRGRSPPDRKDYLRETQNSVSAMAAGSFKMARWNRRPRGCVATRQRIDPDSAVEEKGITILTMWQKKMLIPFTV